MNKEFISFLLLLFVTFNHAQEKTNPKGSPYFKVFWNYHNEFTKDLAQNSAFELKRVYLGYAYSFNKNISAKITYDIGSNSAGSAYTAYVKIAQLDWKLNPKIKLSLGLIGTKQFKEQKDLWGYRYVLKTFQNEYKFGTSADLGFNSEFTLTHKLKMNLFVLNGEGYKNPQDRDGNQRIGISLMYSLPKGVSTKFYYDSHPTKGSNAISNTSFYVGYKGDNSRIAIEYNKLNNARTYKSAAADHNKDGLSLYGSKKINSKYEIFGRFDQVNSNVLKEESNSWNYNNDGSLIILGAQYQAIKGVKLSLNYRLFKYKNSIINNKSAVYLNAEFKI